MKRQLLLAVPVLAAAVLSASPAIAQSRGVGLGAAAGIALPDSNLDYDPSVNWGFFVDIPLIYTFHITPSTIVYRLNLKDTEQGAWTTDVSLNFKFIVPIGPLSLFAGVMAGLTAVEKLEPHMGVLGGGAINLISNIDVFVQANYKFQFSDNELQGNIKNLQIYAGPLFRFQ